MDECDSSPCTADATCENIIGNFTCTCNSGYTDNGLFCEGNHILCISVMLSCYSADVSIHDQMLMSVCRAMRNVATLTASIWKEVIHANA